MPYNFERRNFGLEAEWSEEEEPPIYGRENLTAEQSAALDAVIAAHDPDRPAPVTEIHIAWLEQALLEIDRLDAVNAAVAADPVKASLWRRVVIVNRSDPDVIAVAAALSIDLDTLFSRADAIRRARRPA